MKIFESKNASKLIDGVRILSNISICISRGERIAITGSNGSGKSSLLKLVGGIYEASEGDLARTDVKIGYIPEHFPENIRFKIKDYLMLIGKMNHISDEVLARKINGYAEVFSVNSFLQTPLRKCSKGTKQKVGIIQAMLKSPNLLLLDEPLTGLDDQAQAELLHQLQSLPNDVTIVFTAHEQLLIEGLAQRVIRVEEGKISFDSSIHKEEKYKIIKVRIPSREWLDELPPYRNIGENCVEMMVPVQESDQVLRALLERRCSILEVAEKR